MAKYEIMLVVRGDLEEAVANGVCDELVASLGAQNVNITKHGVKEMAYQIKKLDRGYYYQINFESENVEGLNEFRRLARINKNVLRQLIINLEKDYGYRATVNAKKVARNEKRAQIYAKVQEENKRRAEERLAMQAAQANATSEK